MVFAIYGTKLCWVGKHITIIMKPTNSPTQGQPKPMKIRLEVAFGPVFLSTFFFSWAGIGFIFETDHKKPNPTKLSAIIGVPAAVAVPAAAAVGVRSQRSFSWGVGFGVFSALYLSVELGGLAPWLCRSVCSRPLPLSLGVPALCLLLCL